MKERAEPWSTPILVVNSGNTNPFHAYVVDLLEW